MSKHIAIMVGGYGMAAAAILALSACSRDSAPSPAPEPASDQASTPADPSMQPNPAHNPDP